MDSSSMLGPFISLAWLVVTIWGLVRLLGNWDGYANKAWPMLVVCLLIPFGGLWPILTEPATSSKSA